MTSNSFTGYYGMHNYGDDLFSIACIQGAQKWWGDPTPKLLAPAPIEAVEFSGSNSLVYRRLFSRMDFIGKATRSIAAIPEALNSRRLVFGGGSLFSRDRSRLFELLDKISALRHKEIAAIGVSIEPFDNVAKEKALLKLLQKFSYISVRDRASLERLSGYRLNAKISFGHDLAGVLGPVNGDWLNTTRSQRVIGFSSCNLGANNRFAEFFDYSFVNEIKRLKNCSVVVFNLNNHPIIGDTLRNRRVYEELILAGIDVKFVDYLNIGALATFREIANCTAMVSIRLHGAISAYLSGVPFILMEYHHKCTDFLDDIGQDPVLRVGISRTGDSNLSSPSFRTALNFLLTEAPNPTLNRHSFSRDATEHFTLAPWSTNNIIS